MNYTADEQHEGIRFDIFLAELMPDLSRTKIQKYIKEGKFTVNGLNVKSSAVLKEGDVIYVDGNCQIPVIPKIEPENIPLSVIWEDENMAVINKPSGMLTHPVPNETSGTLVNALLCKYGNNLSDINGDLRRGILHRLDRNTSGLIMIAKNNQTHEFLTKQMKDKKFTKKYRAVVKGVIKEDSLVIDKPIGRHPVKTNKMAVIDNTSSGVKNPKDALTLVNVIKRFKDATYLDIQIVTGRTHQIRVHLSSIGHPVYNDTLYGFGKMKIKTDEQVLQSYKLEFTKPFTDERITVEIPPDEKLSRVINYLENIE